MNRPSLPDNAIDTRALAAMQDFHKDIVSEVQAAIRSHRIVVVGMAQNPFVIRVRNALQDAGLEFHVLQYGSYISGWKKRLAIKLWSGWPTFPQVFVNGTLIGGYRDTIRLIKEGSLPKS